MRWSRLGGSLALPICGIDVAWSVHGRYRDGAAFEGGFFADGVCAVAGGFVGRRVLGPEVVPVDGHEDGADLDVAVNVEDAPGAAAAAFDLDALAVVKSQGGGIFRVHLQKWRGVELVEFGGVSGFGAGVPLVGDAAGC